MASTKRKLGRPAKTGTTRTLVRLPDDELELYRARAAEQRLDLSTYLRLQLKKAHDIK